MFLLRRLTDNTMTSNSSDSCSDADAAYAADRRGGNDASSDAWYSNDAARVRHCRSNGHNEEHGENQEFHLDFLIGSVEDLCHFAPHNGIYIERKLCLGDSLFSFLSFFR